MADVTLTNNTDGPIYLPGLQIELRPGQSHTFPRWLPELEAQPSLMERVQSGDLSISANIEPWELTWRGAIAGAHAATHHQGGGDELLVEALGTGEADATFVLKPDGAGGLVWGPVETGPGTGVADINATRVFHEPTVTAVDAEPQPGQGPLATVIGTTVCLHFDQPDDKAYRFFKIPENFVGNPSFHIHWTKAGDADASGTSVRWRIEYTVFPGGGTDIAGAPPTILTVDDVYEDASVGGTRIMYRTPNIAASGFMPGYYIGVCVDYDDANTSLTSDPVLVSVDLIWTGNINQ